MTKQNTVMAQQPTLAEQTEQALQEFLSGLPKEDQTTIAGSFERLLKSDVAKDAIGISDTAPDFILPNARGGNLQLSKALKNGPVVLSFYRGGWCPFCNLEFKALQERLPEMNALGATLIGISPETPDNSLSTMEKHQLQFDVLSDVGNKVARDYGLVMTLDEAMRPLYAEWGIDLPASNGDDSFELPVPATYVIDTHGVVRAAHVDKDYTKRMEPEDIITTLRELQA